MLQCSLSLMAKRPKIRSDATRGSIGRSNVCSVPFLWSCKVLSCGIAGMDHHILFMIMISHCCLEQELLLAV